MIIERVAPLIIIQTIVKLHEALGETSALHDERQLSRSNGGVWRRVDKNRPIPVQTMFGENILTLLEELLFHVSVGVHGFCWYPKQIYEFRGVTTNDGHSKDLAAAFMCLDIGLRSARSHLDSVSLTPEQPHSSYPQLRLFLGSFCRRRMFMHVLVFFFLSRNSH